MTRIAPPSNDPKEQRLREEWYALKAKAEETGEALDQGAFASKNDEIAKYLWDRVEADIAEDRRRHPKKKRNLPVSSGGPSGGRMLP